jgi:hypothetical protein
MQFSFEPNQNDYRRLEYIDMSQSNDKEKEMENYMAKKLICLVMNNAVTISISSWKKNICKKR